MRKVERQYIDALDLIWTVTARRLGFRILRSKDVFASSDGRGAITLSVPEEFDKDDSLAQLIFHELCHAIVEGPDSHTKRDWGLSNFDDSDLVREHACHRVQAALSQQFGLREFFGVTTEWRPYYDNLPAAPLELCSDPASHIAAKAFQRFTNSNWRPHIENALISTALIAKAVKEYADDDSLWATCETNYDEA